MSVAKRPTADRLDSGATTAHANAAELPADAAATQTGEPDATPTVSPDLGGGTAGGAGVTAEHPQRYELLREFGRGGQSVVHLVYDSHVGRQIAFKQLLPERRAKAAAGGVLGQIESRFLREARITGQLEHPGIVPVYEVGARADGSLYYTQKLVRGRDLQSALEVCTSLAERLRLTTHFLGICHAIAYAHRRGVIHRDLKPANVMVGELGETVVLDWGLAKTRRDRGSLDGADPIESLLSVDAARTREGAVLGTPAYMSPEQAINATGADERSDVWSLGVILYEILTGRRAFAGKTTEDVLREVATASVPPAHELSPQAPRELSAIAERAMSRDLSRRYPDAAALAADVEAWSTGARVAAYDYPAWQLAVRFARQHKALVVAAAALLIGITYLATIIGGQFLSITRAGERKDHLDRRIAVLEDLIEREPDRARLGPMADELATVVREAQTAAAELRALGARPERFAPPPGAHPEIEAAIRRVLARFGADAYALPPSFVRRVDWHFRALLARPGSDAVYRRKLQVWPLLQREFLGQGLPIEMAYVAWTESQFDPLAESHVGARGMWGFMPGTARLYGLRVDAEVDERTDVAKSTRAAVHFLSVLIAELGGTESFMLVLASYNKGENAIRRVLREVALEPGGWRRERREFWHLHRLRRLSAETAEYLPQIFAAIIANSDPRKHGLERGSVP